MLTAIFLTPTLVGCVSEPAVVDRFGDLQTEPCSHVVPGVPDDVRCATIEVPQVHGDPSSRTLTLRVFATGTPVSRSREPVIYLVGGPGGSAGSVASWGMTSLVSKALDRDVLLLEQRGDALSRPALDCRLDGPEVDGKEQVEERLRQCVVDYRTQGTRLEAFNTIESAHDIEDLRRAIVVEKVIVWGVSYGALLAGAFAREHPDSTAGLVLESSVLGDRPYRSIEQAVAFPHKVDEFTSWLRAACAANAHCAAQYPGFDPAAEIDALLERVKAGPVVLTDGVVIDSPTTLDNLRFRSMYSIPNAALLLRAVWASNHDRLAEFGAIRVGPVSALDVLRRALDVTSEISSTTNEVVNCYDVGRVLTDEGLATSVSRLPEQDRAEAAYSMNDRRARCSALPAPSVDQGRFIAPVGSNIPTLFFGGRLDAVTPIEWALEDARRFPRSQVVVSDCMSHGPIFSATACSMTILARFFDHLDVDPSTFNLDTTCVASRCSGSAIEGDLLIESVR